MKNIGKDKNKKEGYSFLFHFIEKKVMFAEFGKISFKLLNYI